MDIPGAEAQHEITGREHVPDIAMQAIKPRLITDAAMPMMLDLVGDRHSSNS